MIGIHGAQLVSGEQLQRLRQRAQRAVEFFEENFGPVSGPLKIDLEAQETLSTGYNAETATICFPEVRNLIDRGLDSVDVVDHEIFHALVARRFPSTGGPEVLNSSEGQLLHESLADYFAYKMNPDPHFGENFRKDKEFLRSYHNDLTVSLSPGSHAQGNALTAHLLREQVELPQIRQFLQAGDFRLAALQQVSPGLKQALARDASFAVEQRVRQYPPSALNRYRIQPGRPLEVDFQPNAALLEAHPNFRVDWSTMEGVPSRHYIMESQDGRHFQIESTPQSRPEKLLARYYDGPRLIGSQPYYLSSA
ncbi:MAG: hypothetical protein KF760_04340 [Candidatus Eremiobacteraeota bacterium]|nr:hypothetical protein [Candidatus Eremiobacteraeota bacterium]MCW5867144.1 hypothetical protein [Candidatus Eremiobacteraeota bacterium]